ncbi:MAG: phage integrase N-terminal SAM-like domain-containing protein, partial [Gammaproteobacteria bacterium]|nr:phage integrase N-terminal SAM-like domain-containing protein [Gammaproteobacteria bacterium]
MKSIEQERFTTLYSQMQQALILQGMQPKTIDAYSRAIRRVAKSVDRCPDNLTADELKHYFASLVE